MSECFVSFATPSDVRDFVAIATKQIFPIEVEHGNMKTNAKSIMSLFSMGLNRRLRVVIGDKDADASTFFMALTPFMVA